MKIAVMMRAMDQDTGFRVYVENLVENLLRIDPDNQYLLLYRKPKWLGRFASHGNAEELLMGPSHKLLWDQCAVPYAAWKRQADVIFNPKFSVPLISHCPVTMGIQEPAWWATPQHHRWWDVLYMRMMLPAYCRKSAHLFPWSQFVADENRKYLKLPLENVTVTFAAPNPMFRPVDDPSQLAAFKEKYELPERFILSVTRVENIGNEATTFTETKNIEAVIRAYALCRNEVPHELVVAGRRVREYLRSNGWEDESLRGIRFLGFVPQQDLVMLYNTAELFVLPSYYEGFGLTQTEAMACGCPVITSKTGASPEITGGAALLTDPDDPSDLADKMLTVLRDDALRERLGRQSLERSDFFSWEKTARLVLEGLRGVLNRSKAPTVAGQRL